MSEMSTSSPDATCSAHVTTVVVWDVPSAIAIGARFRIKVGMKCSNACDLTDGDFAISNHDGAPVAAGKLSGDCWPDTTGLYVEEVELEAPPAEGLYTWSVNGAVSFGVRVVRQPEYLVTVKTLDNVNRTPLSGARVVMHPYQAVTDEGGTAEVRVPRGTYQLFVSQNRYLTFGLPVEVTADMTTTVELDVEPVPERY